MKKLLWLGLGLVAGSWAVAAESLAQRVSAEEFRQAGLEKLSAAELAQLEVLFQKYGGAPAGKSATVVAAESGRAAGEPGVREAEKTVRVAPGTKVEVMAIETEVVGEFDGWDGTSTWRMKDGTTWRVVNRPAPFQTKRTMNPKVKIYPAAVSGTWLEFIEAGVKVRVRAVN